MAQFEGYGARRLLGVALNREPLEDLILRLSETPQPPYREIAGAGYAPIRLATGYWQFPDDEVPEATYAEQVFTFTGPLERHVAAYYVTMGYFGRVLWGDVFLDGPYRIRVAGDQVMLLPRIVLGKGGGRELSAFSDLSGRG